MWNSHDYTSFLLNAAMVILMGMVYGSHEIINKQQNTIEQLQLDILQLKKSVEKNKKDIRDIRYDMCDYLDFKGDFDSDTQSE